MADRLGALFSKGLEDPGPLGPSCLKGSGGGGSGGGLGDGCRTRSKRKRVTFLLPDGVPAPKGASGRNDPVRRKSPEPVATVPVARTTRSRALRPREGVGTGIPSSDARSTRKSRGARGLGHDHVDRSSANSGEEDSGDCAVDEVLVVGTRSLRHRVVFAAGDGALRRSRKRSDPGVTEEARVSAAAAAPDAVTVSEVPENSEVGGRRGSRKRRQDPVLVVGTSPQGSKSVSENVARDEVDRGGPRRSKRNQQNREGAVAGGGAPEISSPDMPEVGVKSEEEGAAQVLKLQRPSRRKSVKFRNEELRDGDHGGGAGNKVQRQTRNNESVVSDEESCQEIGKKSERVIQGGEPLRRSRRNASNRNKLVQDILLTEGGKSEDDDAKVARLTLPGKPKPRTVKRGVALARETEKKTQCLEVQEYHTQVSDYDELASKRKRRKSIKCDVSEQKVSLLPVVKPGDDKDLVTNKRLRETKSQRLQKKASKNFTFSDRISDEIEAAPENVEESVELLELGDDSRESKCQSSEDASDLTKQEKMADDLVQNRDPFLEIGLPLEESETGDHPEKRVIQQGDDNSQEPVQDAEAPSLSEISEKGRCADVTKFVSVHDQGSESHDESLSNLLIRSKNEKVDAEAVAASLLKKQPLDLCKTPHSDGMHKSSFSAHSQSYVLTADDQGRLNMVSASESHEDSLPSPLMESGGDEKVLDEAVAGTLLRTGSLKKEYKYPGAGGVHHGDHQLDFAEADDPCVAHAISNTSGGDPQLSCEVATKETEVSSQNHVVQENIGEHLGRNFVCQGSGLAGESEKSAEIFRQRNEEPSSGLMSESKCGVSPSEEVAASCSACQSVFGASNPTVSRHLAGFNETDVYTPSQPLVANNVAGVPSKGTSGPKKLKGSQFTNTKDDCFVRETMEILTDEENAVQFSKAIRFTAEKNPSLNEHEETMEDRADVLDEAMLNETAQQTKIKEVEDAAFSNRSCENSSNTDSKQGSLTNHIGTLEAMADAHYSMMLGHKVADQIANSEVMEGEITSNSAANFTEHDKIAVFPIRNFGRESELEAEGQYNVTMPLHASACEKGIESIKGQEPGRSAALLDVVTPDNKLTEQIANTEEMEGEFASTSAVNFTGRMPSIGDLDRETELRDEKLVVMQESENGILLPSPVRNPEMEGRCSATVPLHASACEAGTESSNKGGTERSAELLDMVTAGDKVADQIANTEEMEGEVSPSCEVNFMGHKEITMRSISDLGSETEMRDEKILVTHESGDGISVTSLVKDPESEGEYSVTMPLHTPACEKGTESADEQETVRSAELLDMILAGSKVADQIANVEERGGEVARNCAVNFIGNMETELVHEKLLGTGKSEDDIVAASVVENLESEGQYGVVTPLYSPGCENGIESADEQDTERSTELLDVVVPGKEVQIAGTEEIEGEVASNCMLNFTGQREIAMPSIGNLDGETELRDEDLMVTRESEEGILVPSQVKDPESQGAMTLHAPACEKGIESADEQETERSAEPLCMAVADHIDENFTSCQGINSEVHTVASDVAVASVSVNQHACESYNAAKSRHLGDDIVVESHAFPGNAVEESVVNRTCPIDLADEMSIYKERRHVLCTNSELSMVNDIVYNKEYSDDIDYDPTNSKETAFFNSIGTIEKEPCEAGLDKQRETVELANDALGSDEKLGTEIAWGMESAAGEGETTHQNILDLEEKETPQLQLGLIHPLSAVKTPKAQDSAQRKGPETKDKLVEGADPDDQCAIRADGSSFWENKPLQEEPVILYIGPTGDANMSLRVKSPESSFVEIENDGCELVTMQLLSSSDGKDNDGCLEFKHQKLISLVNCVNVESLESSITKKLCPDRSRNFPLVELNRHDSSYETYSVLQVPTENSIGIHDFVVDHDENNKEDDKSNRQVSEQELSSEEVNLREKGDVAVDEIKVGVPVAEVQEADESRREKPEKKSSCKRTREAYEAMNVMTVNDCTDQRELEQEANGPNFGLSEEKLDHVAEYRCLLEQNEETLAEEGLAVCDNPETLVKESWGGRLDGSCEHDTRNDEEEDVSTIFGNQPDNGNEDAPSNKQGSTSGQGYSAYSEIPVFQGLLDEVQISITGEADIEANLEQVQGCWDLENAVKNIFHAEEAETEQDKGAVEITTEASEIQDQIQDFDHLAGFESLCYQDLKDEPTYRLADKDARESSSFEGHNSEEIVALEDTKNNTESSKGQEDIGAESVDYCTFVSCGIDQRDQEQSISKLTEHHTREDHRKVGEFCRNTLNVEEMNLLDVMSDRNNDEVKLQLASSNGFVVDTDLDARSNVGEGEHTLFSMNSAFANFLGECDSVYDKPQKVGKAEDGALENHFGCEPLSDGGKQSLSNLDFGVPPEGAFGSSLENDALCKVYIDDKNDCVKEEVAIIANGINIQNLQCVEEEIKYSERDSTASNVFPDSDYSSCRGTIGGLAVDKEINDIFSDMHISSAKKHMISSRISCTQKRNHSSEDFLQIENMKENTPHSKMVHATIIAEKSTIPTSRRRALVDLQNIIHRE